MRRERRSLARPAISTAKMSCASSPTSRRPRVSSPRSFGIFLPEIRPRRNWSPRWRRYFARRAINFKPLLRTIFLSEEFYAPNVIRNQVKSPVQWLVGSVRLLERDLAAADGVLGRRAISARICLRRRTSKAGMAASAGSPPTICSPATIKPRRWFRGYCPPPAGPVAGSKQSQHAQRQHQNAGMRKIRRWRRVDAEKIFQREGTQRQGSALIAALEKRLLQGQLKGNRSRPCAIIWIRRAKWTTRRFRRDSPGHDHAGISTDLNSANL